MSSEMGQQPDGGDSAPFGPMKSITVPATFQGWCSLLSDILAPAEELSPFKLGQIKELISDIDHNAGLVVAPAFVVGQILFLISFILYLSLAIYALAVDADAMADACATESWIWLYVLLVVAIPTGLGLFMGLIKTGLKLARVKVPPALLSLPGPVCYIALGVLGILLWATMSPVCDAAYASKYLLLYVVFKVQVFIMGIAAIFGALTTTAQTSVLLAHFRDQDSDLPALRSSLNDSIGGSVESRKRYVDSSNGIIDDLKERLARTQQQRDELNARRDAARKERGDFELPETFGEFSSMVVHRLAPVEELSPFKLGQIQELVGAVSKDVGDAIAPYFAVGIVLFLLAFVAYVTVAIIALVLDSKAIADVCADDYWIWVYVLLALALPLSLGLLTGLLKTVLNAADLKKNVGCEIPAVFLALPAPIVYIVLGVLGILIWATMDDECTDWYSQNTLMLLIVFRIQVILVCVSGCLRARASVCVISASMGVAAILGLAT